MPLSDTERWMLNWFNENASCGGMMRYEPGKPVFMGFILRELADELDKYIAEKQSCQS